MAEKSTWIKLDRNILEWGWYTDPNTMRVWIHLLIRANVKDGMFLGERIKRGELATSQSNLAEELGLSIFNIRTALKHLKATGEVTVRTTPKFSVITIVNYDRYQDKPQAKSQATSTLSHKQATDEPQQSKNIRYIEEKNIDTAPAQEPRDWEKNIPEKFVGWFDTEEDWRKWWGVES